MGNEYNLIAATQQKRRLTKVEQTHMAKRMARVAELLHNHNRQVGDLLQEAYQCAAREERAHRGLGRLLVGDIGVRLSVTRTAWLFVARIFFSTEYDKAYTALELATLRDDYRAGLMARALANDSVKTYGEMSQPDRALSLYAYALEIFNAPGKPGQAYGVEGITQWDYSRDVAGR
jgi:hypothetical protein